jgi:hypothetical protein
MGGSLMLRKIYILAMMLGMVSCGWLKMPQTLQALRTPKTPETPAVQPSPETPAVQSPPSTAFQPTCARLPTGYKMDLLRLSERLRQKGRTVIIGLCQGECAFVVYVGEQNGTASVSPSEASESRLALQLPTELDGKPVCVKEGEPPTE